MSKMTQCDRIMRHLDEHGSITQLEALGEYGIMRLASRISDLRRNGNNIVKDTVTGKNRYGEPVSFARYRMGDKQ